MDASEQNDGLEIQIGYGGEWMRGMYMRKMGVSIIGDPEGV